MSAAPAIPRYTTVSQGSWGEGATILRSADRANPGDDPWNTDVGSHLGVFRGGATPPSPRLPTVQGSDSAAHAAVLPR